ncbi:hypothetical protein DICVIV_08295 [Dictyocaulus viviparus]|uniref:CEP76/DRC7 peptidase-like domain-containing protein n=1 Tax=Dictyocaulus viviparus TaxID=29172 RepID=A0A0D8XM72_DICVI|nr:hypothetical protein DICVIV_08295 [Dictyocaulus viviparus]
MLILVNVLDKDDREVNTIHEQLVRRLIGWIDIPFSTIFSFGKIDGWLRLRRPNFHTEYSIPDSPSYIKVLIAFKPSIIPPRIIPPRLLDSLENEKIISQCQSWLNTCNSLYNSRRYIALVTDINGKAVLACRYLCPVSPPPVIPQSDATNPMKPIKIAARLVSMIPFITDPVLFPGSTDLWTSNEKFLSLGCGDEEEHAVLLCCWLLSLEITSYLVLGSSLPEGLKAAYVLVMLPDGIYLINPCDGSVYSSTDPMCPFISIGTIITSTNIYGNIQSFSHPSQMRFDLNKTNDWRPVFDKQLVELRSLQSASLIYTQISDDVIVELRSAIEREIKLCFDEARQYGIPQWNLMASRLLRELMQDEQHTVDNRFGRLRESYTVTATAITIPYRSIQDCVNAVLRCALHTTTSVSTQFALAVHLQPVFHNVIICNIAIAMLTLRK